MAISILNNIASLAAQNQLQITQQNLQKTLFQFPLVRESIPVRMTPQASQSPTDCKPT